MASQPVAVEPLVIVLGLNLMVIDPSAAVERRVLPGPLSDFLASSSFQSRFSAAVLVPL